MFFASLSPDSSCSIRQIIVKPAHSNHLKGFHHTVLKVKVKGTSP